jgi:hypothetical protein
MQPGESQGRIKAPGNGFDGADLLHIVMHVRDLYIRIYV